MSLSVDTKNLFNTKKLTDIITIVKNISQNDKIWAVGGIVYRNIINQVYKINKNKELFDFDFIVEKVPSFDRINVPMGWRLTKTGLGDIRLIKENKQIDIFPINNAVLMSDHNKTKHMKTIQKLESYFKRVPLTVQAIAYDIQKQKIIGDIGIKAIKDKKIEINNLDECIAFCKRRKISIREFIKKKSDSLNFEPIFPKFNNEKYKKKTKSFYDSYVKEYGGNGAEDYSSFIWNNLESEVEYFINNLNGKIILDLGCGPGRDALFFKNKKLDPVCIDISSSMIKECKDKGLTAYEMDMEDISLNNHSFDGVWAYASLLHIPKERIYNVLARIRELLKPGGLFFLGMVEGNSEVFYQSSNKPGEIRFFSLYSDRELRNILNDYFEIIKFKKFKSKKGVYLNYICKSKNFSSP